MTQGKWRIDFVKKAKKEFEKLPKDIQSTHRGFFQRPRDQQRQSVRVGDILNGG